MEFSNSDKDELANKAIVEVRKRREAEEHIVVAIIARAHEADRQRVC
jgi:hypothetical protein